MSDMTEMDNKVLLAGRLIGVRRPTQGQMEALVRIARGLMRGTDDNPNDFWQKQVDRLGTLLDSLIDEADQDIVDQMYLTGKIDHTALLTAILGKVNDEAVKSEDKAIAKAKASPARVKRQ